MFNLIMDNFKDTVEAMIPDVDPGRRFKFLDADPEDASKTAASDRRFCVIPEDGIEIQGALSASTTIRLVKVIYVTIQYRVGKSMTEFLKRVHMDVDRLAYTLSRTSSYCRGDNYALLARMPSPEFRVDVDDAGLSAVVHVPFGIVYSITY